MTRPNVAIAEAVATVTDSEPMELPPLQQTIDVDALNALLTGESDADFRITFTYNDVVVTAKRDGTIEVYSS